MMGPDHCHGIFMIAAVRADKQRGRGVGWGDLSPMHQRESLLLPHTRGNPAHTPTLTSRLQRLRQPSSLV